MAVPKKKHTNRRTKNRRSHGHGKVTVKQLSSCSNCGYHAMPHRVCSRCGFYKGKKIFAKLI